MLMLMILQDFGYFLKHNDLILRFAVAILKCREFLINCDRNRIKVGPYNRLWEKSSSLPFHSHHKLNAVSGYGSSG